MMQLRPGKFRVIDSRCHYCGCDTIKPGNCEPDHSMARTRDHVRPRALAGRLTVTCCFRCNQVKADHDYEEFRLFARLLLRKKTPRPSVREATLMFNAWLTARMF